MKAHKKKPNQSSRPETAVLTVDAVESQSYKQPPTEDELEIQDREGMHTMFLVEEVIVKGASLTMPALAFHDNGSNVTMIRRELAEKLGLAGCKVRQKLVRLGDHSLQSPHPQQRWQGRRLDSHGDGGDLV